MKENPSAGSVRDRLATENLESDLAFRVQISILTPIDADGLERAQEALKNDAFHAKKQNSTIK